MEQLCNLEYKDNEYSEILSIVLLSSNGGYSSL